jgi:xanthine dehydrogenase YagS FAD-binding subunit
MPLEKFFVLPSETVRRENVLKDGEIVTEVQVPATAAKSTYLKFKERDSLDFAMASVAAAVEFGAAKTVMNARLTMGGVAPIPWVAKDAAASLIGRTLDEATVKNAATVALADASPLEKNAYKVILAQTLIRRALTQLNA